MPQAVSFNFQFRLIGVQPIADKAYWTTAASQAKKWSMVRILNSRRDSKKRITCSLGKYILRSLSGLLRLYLIDTLVAAN